MHSHSLIQRTLLTCLLAGSCFVNTALAADEVKIPSGVDFLRAKLLARGEPVKVYVDMVGIGDAKEEKLLFPKGRSDTIGNARQLNRWFMDSVQKTQRFEVYDDTSSGVRDKTDLVVDGMVVAATQGIEDFTATRKAITTVRLSIQIRDTATGKVIKARTITGVHGDEPGKGTIIRNDAELSKPETRQKLSNDYVEALKEALENAAAFLERTIRPVGRVRDVEGDTLLLVGGQAHGVRENDKMVVFRAKTMRVGEVESFGLMKPVAVIECGIVTTDSSQCEAKAKGKDWPPQKDDFAVLTDDSLKLKME